MKNNFLTTDYAVIFDMDGVIVDTNPYHSEAFASFFIQHGLDFDKRDFATHMYGKHNSYIMSHFFGRKIEGEELKQLEDEKEALFREIYASKVNPIQGYLPFLKQLIQNGFSCGVATSAPRANLSLITDKLSLHTYMKSMLASEDVTQHKPHPEVYLKSAKNLEIAPEKCLVFEDSFSGITAALNAGSKVVGVLTSHTREELPPCDFYIRDYSEITVDTVLSILIR